MVKERNARRLSRFNKLMLWLNYAAIVALLLSLCAKYISPGSFWIFSFFGLAYPIAALANLCFIIYWFVQMRWQGLFSAIAMLIGINTFLGFFQVDLSRETPDNKDIKVMSYNSMLFDLYNWSRNKQSRNMILDMLAEENPDILCLQEFYNSEEKGDFHNADTLTSLLNSKNIHYEYTTTLRQTDHWGIATLTKYPIIKKGRIDFNVRSNNICIYTDVLIDKDTVRIYNMHLQSISFSKADYKFIEEVNNEVDAQDEVLHSKSILRRLKRAFVKRASQADAIAEDIRNCHYRVIICGDFNDTPASYAYRTIRGNLEDAFEECGNGFELTYAGKFPRFRIDYILFDKRLRAIDYYKVRETQTDHYPIVCYLRGNS